MEIVESSQFQTTAPKSCFMRPPSGMLIPGESIIATGKLLITFYNQYEERNRC